MIIYRLAARSLRSLDPHRRSQTFTAATCGGKKGHRFAKRAHVCGKDVIIPSIDIHWPPGSHPASENTPSFRKQND